MNMGYDCLKSSQNSFFLTGVMPKRKRIGLYVSSTEQLETMRYISLHFTSIKHLSSKPSDKRMKE